MIRFSTIFIFSFSRHSHILINQQDKEYCTDSCTSYCAQEDRTDGLSGSVSAANGEVGILGGTFGQGTVAKGEDKVSCDSVTHFCPWNDDCFRAI